jgi:3-oxoacyl-[acyl-carrier protein] reductase
MRQHRDHIAIDAAVRSFPASPQDEHPNEPAEQRDMEIRLDGRVAVITGGSQGLGLAIATRMASSGADVALLARRPDGLKAAHDHVAKVTKGRVLTVSCDVSKADEIARAYVEIMNGLGRIDILVNNAGISQTGAFTSITDEVWQADLDLKLFAAIRLTRLVWPQMTERKWGRVINTLNIGAKAPRAGSAPTSVSRAAGLALTKVLAGEGAPHNVLVNALHVGLIDSDQWVRRHAQSQSNESYEEFLAGMGKGVPMGRVGTSEEFANIACFLASDAGGYITGTAINVDGNLSPVV